MKRKLLRVFLILFCTTAGAAIGAASPAVQQGEGLSISTEMIVAVCAIVGVIGTILAVVFRGGQLSNQIDATKDLAEKLGAKVDEHETKFDGLSRVIFEMRGAMQAQRSSPSRPPIGRTDDDDN